MPKFRFFAPCIIGLTCFINSAAAQDRCASVLQHGTFKTEQYRSNDYFRQIIHSRFLRSSYASSKSDTGLGFGVPLGDIVLGGNYNNAEYDQKKSQLQSEYLNSITQSREIDIALSSGDPAVLDAWTTCMKNGSGGPTLTLAVQSPTEVQINIGFLSAAGSFMQLAETMSVPQGGEVLSGKNCLKKGVKIHAGAPCLATVRLPSATTTWNPTVQTKSNGSAAAYLTARIEFVTEVRPFRFDNDCQSLPAEHVPALEAQCPHRLYQYIHRKEVNPSHTVVIPDALLAQGWYFDTSGSRADLNVHKRYSPSGMSWCNAPWLRSSPYAISYGYYAIARSSGHDQTSVLVCSMTPQISLVRQHWLPKKTVSAASIPAMLIK